MADNVFLGPAGYPKQFSFVGELKGIEKADNFKLTLPPDAAIIRCLYENTTGNVPIGVLFVGTLVGYVGSVGDLVGLAPVRAASSEAYNVTYSNGSSGVGATLTNAGTQAALVVNGQGVEVDDAILIKDQADPKQNGVYVVTNVGSGSTNWVLTRRTDSDSPAELALGHFVVSNDGSGNPGTEVLYVQNTPGTLVIGTSAIVYVAMSYGTQYTVSENVLSPYTISIETIEANGVIVDSIPPTLDPTDVNPDAPALRQRAGFFSRTDPADIYFVMASEEAGVVGDWNSVVLNVDAMYVQFS